ncbi:hypothetical protein ISTM_218 [Insectomime virus]|nr:hypothetical protein ISTM_218 [Insectomime virus]
MQVFLEPREWLCHSLGSQTPLEEKPWIERIETSIDIDEKMVQVFIDIKGMTTVIKNTEKRHGPFEMTANLSSRLTANVLLKETKGSYFNGQTLAFERKIWSNIGEVKKLLEEKSFGRGENIFV